MTKEKKSPQEIQDADLKHVHGGAFNPKEYTVSKTVPWDRKKSTSTGTSAMTEEIEMVIEMLERG